MATQTLPHLQVVPPPCPAWARCLRVTARVHSYCRCLADAQSAAETAQRRPVQARRSSQPGLTHENTFFYNTE